VSDPHRGPARLLRVLTGADEDLLDTVPTERARYTAMGGVVLGTAVMAMFSMAVALICVFDGFNASILIFVPIWGTFILFLDRWMMSSAAARGGGARLRKLLPRLVLSIVFGVIIAEPLLLGVFHTAIEERVADDRAQSLIKRQSDLSRCNPLPGAPVARNAPDPNGPACKDLRLSVQTGVPAKDKQLADVTAQRDQQQKDNDADDKQYADLEEKARRECNGTKGTGLSGRTGQGPNCRRLRQEADKFHADHQIDAHHRKLTALNQQIDTITGQLAGDRSTTGDKISKAIADDVAGRRAKQKDIGLLERLAALGHLVHDDSHVHAAEWALRLFFIGVDSLPVLLKFLSGFSAYDHVVHDRVTAQRRGQRVASETERRRLVIQEELARHQMNAEHYSAVSKVDFDARMRHVDVEMLREELTDSRASYLLHDTPTLPIAVPPRGRPDDTGRQP
jgi:hypothetical protein